MLIFGLPAPAFRSIGEVDSGFQPTNVTSTCAMVLCTRLIIAPSISDYRRSARNGSDGTARPSQGSKHSSNTNSTLTDFMFAPKEFRDRANHVRMSFSGSSKSAQCRRMDAGASAILSRQEPARRASASSPSRPSPLGCLRKLVAAVWTAAFDLSPTTSAFAPLLGDKRTSIQVVMSRRPSRGGF